MKFAWVLAATFAVSACGQSPTAVGAKHSVELLGLPLNITFTHAVPGLKELGIAACVAAAASAYRAMFGRDGGR